jgi:tetrahydromethanopterin S-methyltransferase subunit G
MNKAISKSTAAKAEIKKISKKLKKVNKELEHVNKSMLDNVNIHSLFIYIIIV